MLTQHKNLTATEEEVLRHMGDGHGVSVDGAREKWGIRRLAAVIYDIRQAGYIVEKQMVNTDDGHQMAEYFRPGKMAKRTQTTAPVQAPSGDTANTGYVPSAGALG